MKQGLTPFPTVLTLTWNKGLPVKAQISGRKYQRISLVAAQIQGRSSWIAPMTYCGTMDDNLFEAWFEQMLLPELTEKSVIIMDNARCHRMTVLAEVAERHGIKCCRLLLTHLSLIRLKRYGRILQSICRRFCLFWGEGLCISFFFIFWTASKYSALVSYSTSSTAKVSIRGNP